MDNFFNSSLGVKMDTGRVAQEIVQFMDSGRASYYKVIIGSDSEAHNGLAPDFVTAIVVHRVGNGGRYFWRRVEFGKFYTLRDRIIQEVLLSLDVANEILTELQVMKTPQFDFEIHIDVGENGETKSMIQEVLGMVRAYNFEARTKPESYAASKVADRHI